MNDELLRFLVRLAAELHERARSHHGATAAALEELARAIFVAGAIAEEEAGANERL